MLSLVALVPAPITQGGGYDSGSDSSQGTVNEVVGTIEFEIADLLHVYEHL